MTPAVPTLLRWIDHPQERTGPGLQQQTPQTAGAGVIKIGAGVIVGDGVGAAVGGEVGFLVARPFPVVFFPPLPFNFRVRLSPAGKDASSSIKLDSSLPLNETKGRLFSTTR